ncbi:MAG: hypothetical protein QMD85_02560, partial [Candidatus Aenigmarchaeota archaeon]|nr:hypothetical protein [Candidatus Aenigmarchaeota archaeon]
TQEITSRQSDIASLRSNITAVNNSLGSLAFLNTITTSQITDGTITGSDLASNIGISTSGNIAITGSGTITSAGLLTASNGFTLSSGTLTLPASSITNTMLTGSIAASKLVGTDIATVGTITTGTWNGTPVTVAYGGTGATSAANARTSLGLGSLATLNIITSSEITDGTIANADISVSAAIAYIKLNLADSITTMDIANDAVTAAELANNSVDSDEIQSGAVTGPKLGANAVTTSKISDGTITNADINDAAAITLSKLSSGTSGEIIVVGGSNAPVYLNMSGDATISNIGAVTIANSAITSAKISDGTIATADIADSAVTNAKLSGSIAASKLVGTDIATVGTITTGTWQGTPVAQSYLGGITLPSANITGLGSLATLSAVGTSQIIDSSIVNADISNSAAIAGTKISPDFGSQGITTTGSLTIGGGNPIIKHISVSTANVASGDIAADACGDYATITVTGAAVNDTVVATPTAVAAGIETTNLIWNAYISADNTVKIRACNPTNNGINNADTQTWTVDVWKHA